MCGRFACWLDADGLCRAAAFRSGGQTVQARWLNDGMKSSYRPCYNCSPGNQTAVLVSRDNYEKGKFIRSDQIAVVLVQMDWGVEKPFGAPSSRPLINARAESVATSPFFKDPMMHGRRCAVLTQGFYEWEKTSSGKRPHFIYMLNDEGDPKGDADLERNCKLMPLAGLYFPKRDASASYAYVIVTVDASPGVDSIHNRMPAVLDSDEAVLNWIDSRNCGTIEAVKYLRPYPSLRHHAVSTRVNYSTYDNRENIQPLDETKLAGEAGRKQTPLKAFFSPKKEEPD